LALFPVYLIEIPSVERIDSASFVQSSVPVFLLMSNQVGLVPSILHTSSSAVLIIGAPYLSVAVKLACHGVPALPVNATL
jgi:hypothetical protein